MTVLVKRESIKLKAADEFKEESTNE